MGTSGNRDCQRASRSALKDFTLLKFVKGVKCCFPDKYPRQFTEIRTSRQKSGVQIGQRHIITTKLSAQKCMYVFHDRERTNCSWVK